MPSQNHTCPYCQHKIVLQEADIQENRIVLKFSNERIKHGSTGVQLVSYACPNLDCRELSIVASWEKLVPRLAEMSHFVVEPSIESLATWQLRPESSAKPQPDYIPSQLVEDYNEACRIRDLSPKASATLSRRCLQGMIRDFWDVKDKRNLHQEIEAIRKKVRPSTWEAIDVVREVGNIGAHMEKDVNLIVPVEPREAQLLIRLIERLLHDWYVVRHDEKQQNEELKQLGEEKKAAKHKNTNSSSADSQ